MGVSVVNDATIYFIGEGAAEKALQLSGSDVGGWKAIVTPYPFPEAAGRSLIVCVTGYDTSLSKIKIERALRQHFSSCGRLRDFDISKKFASAEFGIVGEDAQDKVMELDGSDMGGRELHVQVISGAVTAVHTRRYRSIPNKRAWSSEPVDLINHPSGIVPTLQNIVSTVNLDCKLDLKAIALQARNAEYNPKRFAAVIMRIREPKTTALIFASGRMVCTGAKTEDSSKLAARKYARIIQKLGFQAKFKDFKIQNIVASCDVKFPIRLEGLAYYHHAFASYEPEMFPGLIYRIRGMKGMKGAQLVLLIFVSGKIVITGAKKREETYKAFENIYPVLTQFQKKFTR
ncbi:hypothetical protein F2Q68_00000187 [Brassica cretica]|uniref:Uncharacterized protein n=1 Tax=Brassica cretica TaxID=69181 RepID=A0A8S9JN20_BRACR|nr:hypothetical protein F2Q68_00000187 [Brassica cretica]